MAGTEPIEKRIYTKLYKLIPELDSIKEYARLEASGFMPLGVDILSDGKEVTRIALSHYYKHPASSDLIADPDMVLCIYKQEQRVEVISYQDAFTYQEVTPGEKDNPGLRKSLNAFLSQWLDNLLAQGHSMVAKCAR